MPFGRKRTVKKYTTPSGVKVKKVRVTKKSGVVKSKTTTKRGDLTTKQKAKYDPKELSKTGKDIKSKTVTKIKGKGKYGGKMVEKVNRKGKTKIRRTRSFKN